MRFLAGLAAMLALTFSPVNYAAAVALRCGTHAGFLRVHGGQSVPRVARILHQRGLTVEHFFDQFGTYYTLRRYRPCNPAHHIAVGFRTPGLIPLAVDMKVWS